MTKFNLANWMPNKTIQENADNMGICYNYAATLARENSLPFVRKTVNSWKTFKPGEFEEAKAAGNLCYGLEIHNLIVKPFKQSPSDFAGEGCD